MTVEEPELGATIFSRAVAPSNDAKTAGNKRACCLGRAAESSQIARFDSQVAVLVQPSSRLMLMAELLIAINPDEDSRPPFLLRVPLGDQEDALIDVPQKCTCGRAAVIRNNRESRMYSKGFGTSTLRVPRDSVERFCSGYRMSVAGRRITFCRALSGAPNRHGGFGNGKQR